MPYHFYLQFGIHKLQVSLFFSLQQNAIAITRGDNLFSIFILLKKKSLQLHYQLSIILLSII